MAYTMTPAEQLILNDVEVQIKAVNNWGFWTTAAARREDRMAINRIKGSAALNLQGEKKNYVSNALAVIWDNWMRWSDLGQSSLKSHIVAGLKDIRTALTLPINDATPEGVNKAQGLPPIPETSVTAPAAPTGKIFGIPGWMVYTVGGATILFVGWKIVKKIIRKK